jgi:hypothetical protein
MRDEYETAIYNYISYHRDKTSSNNHVFYNDIANSKNSW